MTAELTNHVWQSTLFGGAAGLLTVAFRKNRAHVRYWLWFSASCKFLVPFALLMGLGRHLEWAPAPAIPLTTMQIAQPFSGSLPAFTPATGDWVPIALFGVWACGFALVALTRFRAWLRIRTVVRRSTPLDVPATVEVRSAAWPLEPGVVGLWRPILLLPAGIAERLTPPQLEAVLAHELCHVRRRDNLFAAIHMTVEAVFWFHPLVWWIGARLVEERERACDEEVLSHGSEPQVYAEGILNVCKMYVESPLGCVSGVTGSDLQRRIEAIMMNRIALRLNFAKKLLLTVAGITALAAPVAVGVMHAPALRAQSAAATPEEHERRVAYAKAKFGSTASAMGRTYVQYGPPDTIDDLGSKQVWRYNYLESFRSNVEFEFASGNGPQSMRINWPPPTTYAGKHASFQIYPADAVQMLSVPLDSLSGRVDIIGQINTLLDTGAPGASVANLRDFVQASTGTYQAGFTLKPGSYVCRLLAREQATGRMYTETIEFAVK